MDRTLDGKTILITGATSGMGKVTALRLAQRGASVVLAGRNQATTDATLQEVRRQAPGSDVHALVADLTAQAQVRALAAEYRASYPRLDVLIHNAGAMYGRRELTADGVEKTLALNVLAPFLLTHWLRASLLASAPARVIVVGSHQHQGRRVPFDDLNHERGYKPLAVYGEAKLMAIMYTYALARRTEGTGVTANTLHPGVVATHFGMEAGPMWRAMLTLAGRFSLSPEQGAQTAIYLASAPEVASVSGKYFIKDKPAESSAASRDVAAQERLWAACQRLTGLTAAAAAG
jgi:NAD(P)-dependent dehydrogenase (short-subunit alcohol dehydrogenase family)